jgi:hypothetical protein
MFVCPNPREWARVYRALREARSNRPDILSDPPIALILNGWVFSSARDKHERWARTVAWASANGLAAITDSVRVDGFQRWDRDVPAWDPAADLTAEDDEAPGDSE